VIASDDRKTYIDLVENVFGGVLISPDDEPPSHRFRKDLRGRPWLTGVTMSSMQVTLADDDDDDEDDDEDREQ
jgi:hypothetical protein